MFRLPRQHVLIDAAVEAANVYSRQAARLRSVGVALGGLKSAAAAAARREVSIQGAAAAARRERSIHGDCWLLFASRLSQCLRPRIINKNTSSGLHVRAVGPPPWGSHPGAWSPYGPCVWWKATRMCGRLQNPEDITTPTLASPLPSPHHDIYATT